jgi:hypothetical protein
MANLAQAQGISSQSAVTTSSSGKVSISSRGKDLREVLYDLFVQVKKNFVLESMPKTELFLNLNDVSFDDALSIVLKQGSFKADVRDSIFYISRSSTVAVPSGTGSPTGPAPLSKSEGLPSTTPIDNGDIGPGGTAPVKTQSDPLSGKVTDAELRKRLTTRYALVDLRDLLADFSKQTGVIIEVDADVPTYKVKAFLIDTSLKFALDTVVKKAHLKYLRTDLHSIRVTR